MTRLLANRRDLAHALSYFWNGPASLLRSLETEWRLVATRWIGILLMTPSVGLLDLNPTQQAAAYCVLAAAALYNLFLQFALPRHPQLFSNGYVTTVGDGLLNVAMIMLAGGFSTPLYFLLYTVTISAAMRYGYGPTIAVVGCFVGFDIAERRFVGASVDGPLLVRSGFLLLSGVLASQLRDQARRAQMALEHQLRSAEHDALHDRLTGLANRALLADQLDSAIGAARAAKRSFALLVIDLDRFKEINDTLGHHYGDVLLRLVSQRFADTVGTTGTVARLGGDEFAVLLPRQELSGATEIAGALLQALETPFLIDGHDLDIGASIGAAMFPAHGEDRTSLLRHADVAMYVAKGSANGYSVYDPELDQHSPRRLALVGELRNGIDRNELLLHFQPKLAIRSGVVVGAEALVRWQRTDGTLVPPDQFIPIAERTGLIRPLTRWVLQDSMRHLQGWRRDGLELTVAVNLSMRDLHDPGLPEMVERLLSAHALPPSSLLLEITENGLMAEPVRALDTAMQLRRLGVRLAIDDFGTGYSSLAYLKRLPVDELKIDRSFVRDMSTDEEDAAIVRSTIGLAHDLGLSVVAEGVEDAETWRMLRELDCDVVQGYHVGRPMSAQAFLTWLSQPGFRQLAA